MPSTISLSNPVREPRSSCSYTMRCCWIDPSSVEACARMILRAVMNCASHLVRGPEAPGKVPGRCGAPDDLLREAGEPVALRHDHAQAGHWRLGIVTVPVRPVEDRGHLGKVCLLPELPFVRPRFREGLDPELVEEGHADR